MDTRRYRKLPDAFKTCSWNVTGTLDATSTSRSLTLLSAVKIAQQKMNSLVIEETSELQYPRIPQVGPAEIWDSGVSPMIEPWTTSSGMGGGIDRRGFRIEKHIPHPPNLFIHGFQRKPGTMNEDEIRIR